MALALWTGLSPELSPACRTGSCARLLGALRGGQATVPPQQVGVRGCRDLVGPRCGDWAWEGELPLPTPAGLAVSGEAPGQVAGPGGGDSRAGLHSLPQLCGALTARSCFAADAAADHGSLHLPRQLPEPGRRLLPVPHPADRCRQSQRAASRSHCTSIR